MTARSDLHHRPRAVTVGTLRLTDAAPESGKDGIHQDLRLIHDTSRGVRLLTYTRAQPADLIDRESWIAFDADVRLTL